MAVADRVLSPAETLAAAPMPVSILQAGQASTPTPMLLSSNRKYALLLLFCMAQAVDVFNTSALFSAIPRLKEDLNMTQSDATWLISAYQLTFASFLLIGGKISDVYDPRKAFVGGLTILGFVSLGAGFLNSKIPLIVLRAVCGIFAAGTVPSALSLLVTVFPDPDEQARAIGIFGGSGAIANIGGLVIGGVFVQFASWRWVFWFAALIALPVAALVMLLAPPQAPTANRLQPRAEKVRRLDLPGVVIVTAGLLLFIFGLTEGSTAGWTAPKVLAPLLIAVVLLIPGFFVYERLVPERYAAIPPRMWHYPDFSVLFGAALFPQFWWTAMFTVFTVLWQQVYGWSAISTAVHMIPSGVASFVISFSGGLSQRVRPKYLILGGLILVIGATVLLAFADGPDKYWPLVFPAFCIGSAGAMLVFVHVNVAIFAAAPPTEAGTVGAMYNGALQLGSAVGIAAATSVESSIEARSAAGFDGYEGRRAVFWFIVGVAALEAAAVAAFYRARRDSCENSGAIDQMLDAPDRGERPPPTEEVKDGRSVHSQVV